MLQGHQEQEVIVRARNRHSYSSKRAAPLTTGCLPSIMAVSFDWMYQEDKMDLIGQRLGNYRLVRLLGEGGYAQVYLGQHVFLNMRAAIKVLHTPLAEREIERFCQEAQAVARLAHRNIVRLLEFDVVEGLVFLVMEYAPGGTLRQRHPEGVALPLETIQPYVAQIASALTSIHAHQLIHRDLKPDNLLIGPQQQILLGDFGLAILAQSSSQFKPQEIVGTVAYMAPEQLQGKPC